MSDRTLWGSIVYFLRCLVGLDGPVDRREPPRDLAEWNAAKRRVKESSKKFAREIDHFGDLVYGMQDRGPVAPTRAGGKRARRAKATRKKRRSV